MEKARILLIDDDASFSRLIKRNLEATGRYFIEEENDGIKALETARKFKPDLIFLDVMMPDITGGQIAFQLQADAALCDTPIVFLTGTFPKQDNSQARELAGFPFLVKPVHLEEVTECIDRVLKKSPPQNQIPVG